MCDMSVCDVYTLARPRTKTPTPFCFAIRSTLSLKQYEKLEGYCKYLCVEKDNRLKDWVLALKLARSEKQWIDSPGLFEEYKAVIASNMQLHAASPNVADGAVVAFNENVLVPTQGEYVASPSLNSADSARTTSGKPLLEQRRIRTAPEEEHHRIAKEARRRLRGEIGTKTKKRTKPKPLIDISTL